MRKHFMKSLIAAGFFTIIGAFSCGIVYVIIDYNLLSIDQQNLFPASRQFSLKDCVQGTERVPRTFIIDQTEVAKSVPILTYHRILKDSQITKSHIIDGEVNPMIVKKEDFEKQMHYLKENGFTTLTMMEFYLFMLDELQVPEKSVVLTFDDGYKDNFIEAYPVLKKVDFSATNFVITGAISKRTQPFTPNHVQYASIKELTNACDVFEYHSHTYNFHRREMNEHEQDTAYLNSRTSEEVFEDIQKSIHNLNGENLAFAFPYGEYSPSSIELLKDLGFKMAFTTIDQAATKEDHLYEIPRFNMLHATTFEQFVSYVNSN